MSIPFACTCSMGIMFMCILRSVLEDNMQLLHAFNTSESETFLVSENQPNSYKYTEHVLSFRYVKMKQQLRLFTVVFILFTEWLIPATSLANVKSK